MKLIIQIPCFNEEQTLPVTLADLPKNIPGIDSIEVMIIDDGSSDRTQDVARQCGVHHIVSFRQNRGLARAFMLGLTSALERGADIIVNTDADNQYCGADIPKLVQPILDNQADLVIGDRETHTISHFSGLKKFLQKHGSFLVGLFAGMKIPDATSGFRAISREAALELNVISDFSYTLETLIQAGRKRLAVKSVPIRTNEKLRESRLFKSIFSFMRKSGATMIRVYTTHEPLKVFLRAAVFPFLVAMFLFGRFLYYYILEGGAGHVQSLIFGAVLAIIGASLVIVGVLSDLINANRKLLEQIIRMQRESKNNSSPEATGE